MRPDFTKNIPSFFILILSLLLLLNGCALWTQFFGEDEDEETPTELMDEGLERFNSGSFESAIESFQKIKDRYPYSKFAVEAELKMADALYERALFEEAYEAYGEFEKLHPKNPKIPYVIFQRGMCDFEQSSTIDREQSHIYKAKEEFERLIKRYRRSPYAKKASKKIRECYASLADHELYVGHFYFRTEKYQAAMDRYLYLIEHYPDLGQYYEALDYIKLCKEKIIEEKKEKSWWGKFKQFVFN